MRRLFVDRRRTNTTKNSGTRPRHRLFNREGRELVVIAQELKFFITCKNSRRNQNNELIYGTFIYGYNKETRKFLFKGNFSENNQCVL
jgi:hypothetical protein